MPIFGIKFGWQIAHGLVLTHETATDWFGMLRVERPSQVLYHHRLVVAYNQKRFENSTHCQYAWGIWKNSAKTPVRICYRLNDIDDLTLDTTIYSLQMYFSNSGYRMMLGHLRARGQQTRGRVSMQRIDPRRTVLRWFQITERRSYNVASPNALLHIDGNHKLVR